MRSKGGPTAADVPWRAWVRPPMAWTPLFIALLTMQMTLPVFLRRRWADQKRLLFPLARIPTELTRSSRPGDPLPGLLRSRLFWLAFGVPCAVFLVNGLHYYLPAVPKLRLMRDVGSVFSGRPWTALNGWPYNVYFEMTGVTYLVPDDMAFSLWLFWVLRKLAMVAREALGQVNHDAVLREQGFGGYLFLMATYVWLARRSLADVWSKAMHADPRIDDHQEPMSYRTALIGFAASVLVIVAWARAAGASVGYSLLGLALYLVSITAIARMVAEGGLFIVWPPMARFNRHLVRAFGPRAMGAQTYTILSYLGLKLADNSTSTMANMLDGYRIADLAGLEPRKAALMMLTCMVVAVFASHPAAFHAIYSRSVPALGRFPGIAFVGFGSDIVYNLTAPARFTATDYGHMAGGAAVTFALQVLRQRHVWWPVHPLAYVAMIGAPYLGDRYGFSIFLGWAARRMVQHLGGYRAYAAVGRAALGLVAGQAVILLLWSIVHYFRPINGVPIIE